MVAQDGQTTARSNNDSSDISETIPVISIPLLKGKLVVLPVSVKDLTVNPALDLGAAHPFTITPFTCSKHDKVGGTAAGTTATTATFSFINEIDIILAIPVTSGATTITLTGTTTGLVLWSITLPTTTASQAPVPIQIHPNMAMGTLQVPETVTLTIGADWTSGTISVMVYGN